MSGSSYSTSYKKQARLVRTRAMGIWVVVMFAVLAYLPWVVGQRAIFGVQFTPHWLLNTSLTDINITLIFIVGGVALNLLTGFTGLISLGNAAFFALGAMVASAVGVKWAHLPFPLVILIAGAAGAAVGAIVGLPSLRIRGIYLLLSTMALHFIMVYLYTRYEYTYYGISGVQYLYPSAFGIRLSTDIRWFYFLLILAVITLLLMKNLLRTRPGRAFVAVRDHELAAGSAGINVARARVTSFAVSSFVISAIGAVYVWYLGASTTDTFDLSIAIAFIAIIIIGGLGSLSGTVLGAIVWQLFPPALIAVSELLGPISPGFQSTVNQWQGQITHIVFGVIILVVLVFASTGLAGLWGKVKQAFVRWPYTS